MLQAKAKQTKCNTHTFDLNVFAQEEEEHGPRNLSQVHHASNSGEKNYIA